MTSESEQSSPLEKINALKRHKDELARRIHDLEVVVRNLEDQLISFEARVELLEAARLAEEISRSRDFKDRFCRLYNRIPSTLVNIAELVIETLLIYNHPLVTVTAFIVIKLGKIKVENYCQDR